MGYNPYKKVDIDKKEEKEGKWFFNEFDGFAFKLGRTSDGNVEWKKALADIAKKKSFKNLKEAAQNKMLLELYAKTVVKDWAVEVEFDEETGEATYEYGKIHVYNSETDEVTIEDFSVDHVISVLRGYEPVYDKIRELSNQYENFLKENEDDIVKN